MIKFGDVSSELQKNNLEDTNAYKEIKPQEALSKEMADDYWDNLFENEIETPEFDDELLFSVFDRSEDEFDFDFEISDDIIELLQKIKGKYTTSSRKNCISVVCLYWNKYACFAI